MPAAHRQFDGRSCGAITIVSGQGSVYVNNKLWAVDGDQNSHGAGGLRPSGSSVYVEGKLVIVNSPDSAAPDRLCPVVGGSHCAPSTSEGSGDVSAY
jgi:hypothetical protein